HLILHSRCHLRNGGFASAIQYCCFTILACTFVPLPKVIGNRIEERGALQLFRKREGSLEFCACRVGISELCDDLATQCPTQCDVLLRRGSQRFLESFVHIT